MMNQICVQPLGGTMFMIEREPDETLGDFRNNVLQKMQKQEPKSIPREIRERKQEATTKDFHLIFDGKILDDDNKKLSDIHTSNGNSLVREETVYLVFNTMQNHHSPTSKKLSDPKPDVGNDVSDTKNTENQNAKKNTIEHTFGCSIQ
jgi:hypothetical protein